MNRSSIVTGTVAALLTPRRLVPILLVCAPMVWVQGRFSADPLAVPLAIILCGSFLLIAPTAWRALMPLGRSVSHVPLRLGLYGLLGVVFIALLGVVIPRVLHMGVTFLTARGSLLVAVALFWVGGWGLGRDIELETSLAHERERAEQMTREAERAQLLALRSHLDPHFLFNTLNAIAEWCREDGVVAEKAVLELSAMLRTVLDGIRASEWPLERELSLLDSLFSLHKIRDPELFTLVRDVPDPVPAVLVPPLALLPLAENAMKHGPCAGHRGEVRLRVSIEGERLIVRLENPGRYAGPRDGGEGVPTVRKRLELAYGSQARLELREEGDRTITEVSLPLAIPTSTLAT